MIPGKCCLSFFDFYSSLKIPIYTGCVRRRVVFITTFSSIFGSSYTQYLNHARFTSRIAKVRANSANRYISIHHGSTVDIRRLNKIYNLAKKQRMRQSSPNAHAMKGTDVRTVMPVMSQSTYTRVF